MLELDLYQQVDRLIELQLIFFFDKFPLRVILLSPSGKTLISDFTRFAFIFFDNFLASSSEDFPEITDRLLNKKI